MLGCAVREIGATLVSRQRLLQPTTRNITTHCATAVHQKHDDPGHPALDAAGYYFEGSSPPANLVLWFGSMFIRLVLAAIGFMKRATICSPRNTSASHPQKSGQEAHSLCIIPPSSTEARYAAIQGLSIRRLIERWSEPPQDVPRARRVTHVPAGCGTFPNDARALARAT